MAKKELYSIKSYHLPHYANVCKQQQLWELYNIYKKEYKLHTKQYFKSFLHNKLNSKFNTTIKFSHLGSTKHIHTQLNSGLLQSLLNQACATLNNYLANIENKFNTILAKSTIKDSDLLHQIRTINTQHKWLYKNKVIVYYPIIEKSIIDDFGNVVLLKEKVETAISQQAKNISHKLFKHIVANHYKSSSNLHNKARVAFPNLNKPRLILDSRLFEYQESEHSTLFHSWINISTLTKGKRILIPLRTNDHFNGIKNNQSVFNGNLGGTIEILFNEYPYVKKDKTIIYKKNSHKRKGFKHKTTNREIQFVFNRKSTVEHIDKDLIKLKEKIVAFDLGLSTLIATSEGELLGQDWLTKLIDYDKQIIALAGERQKQGLKTRSKRYDNLIAQARGFIKTQINRILNNYFENDSSISNIKDRINTVVIEGLNFNNPDLSKRLNRIIKNFGQKLFKDKLKELSVKYGFNVIELNPAYSSQECNVCGYVDSKNRNTQKLFKCLCCKKVVHADIQAALVLKKRFLQDKNQGVKGLNKSIILEKLKVRFISKIPSLIFKGIIGRRGLKELLNKNSYFNNFVITTEASRLKPIAF